MVKIMYLSRTTGFFHLFRENHFNPVTDGNVSTMGSLFPTIRTLTASSIAFTTKFKDFGGGTAGLESAIVALQVEVAAVPGGRIMSSLAGAGGLAYKGGIAGPGGGLAG